MFHHETYALDDRFVGWFARPVTFWVVAGGEFQFNPSQFMELFLKTGHKKFVAIGDYFEWEAILTVPFPKEQLCQALCC